jgi:hypothetical protein
MVEPCVMVRQSCVWFLVLCRCVEEVKNLQALDERMP